MAATLIAHEKQILKVFSDDYVFRIPDYQRPYSWTTEQARELFEDLYGCVSANSGPVASMPAYFLGSIVLIKGDAPAADVVDGQQRLTTLTLLLSALRANMPPGLRPLITNRIYEQGDRFAGTQDRFRLTLRDRDAEFFQKYVQREDGFQNLLQLDSALPDSQRNLRDNALHFQEQINELNSAEREALVGFIIQQCYLVVVATPDQDSAYRIFSVLNSRGLDLSATDILKAKIIGALPEAQRESYTKKWEDAEEDLGRDDFNTLFGHIRTVYRKAKAKETLLKEFEEYVPEVKSPVKFVDDVLIPMARAFDELSTATYAASTAADKVNEYLRWLNRLDFNDWLPPAIAFTVRQRNVPNEMLRFVRDLERLAYYMLVTGQGVNNRIERFAKVTSAVESGADLFGKRSPLQLTPPEQLAFYDRLNGPIYDELAAKARTPVILRLDSLMSDGSASYDYSVVTVEHVLPQKPRSDSDWIKWFPDAAARASVVHRLGNLALLARKKNSAASNWDFDRKKDTYFQRGGICPFVITSEVIAETAWLPAVVTKRQKRLLSVLEKHWRLAERKSESDWLVEELGFDS